MGRNDDLGGGCGMMKYICWVKYALTAACLVFIIGLCMSDPVSDALIDNVEKAVVASVDVSEMTKQPNKMVKRLYGIMPDDYEGVVLYTANSGMAVEEILIVKLKSTDQQDAVAEAMEARVDSQLASFDGYGAQQCALLKKNIVDVQGNYMMLIIHNDGQAAQKAFRDSL